MFSCDFINFEQREMCLKKKNESTTFSSGHSHWLWEKKKIAKNANGQKKITLFYQRYDTSTYSRSCRTTVSKFYAMIHCTSNAGDEKKNTRIEWFAIHLLDWNKIWIKEIQKKTDVNYRLKTFFLIERKKHALTQFRAQNWTKKFIQKVLCVSKPESHTSVK